MHVSVASEWGELKEAIVGTADTLHVPVWTEEYEFSPPEEQAFVSQFGGQLLATVAPERQEVIEAQLQCLADTLQSIGIKVHRPRPLTDDECQYLAHIRNCSQQLFPRDPILVIGNHVIETAMRDPMERKCKFPLRDLFFQQLKNYRYQYVAMPEPNPVIAHQGFGPGPFLEGGDTLLCDRQIFVGVSGHASNQWGVEWLRAYLGDEYAVTVVPLCSGVLHLDCAMALLRPGLAIVCLEAFEQGLPEYFKDWQLIDVTLEQASYLACNGLVIDQERVIIGAEHEELIDRITQAGQQVIPLPFDAVSQFGGAFRCAHHPIVRV